jgi:hypothetical protein
MITRRQLEANPAHHMQELNLHAIRPANSERFRHPLALLRLAMFVRDAADVARTGRRNKWPLAVVGPDDGSGYCCVLGMRHKTLQRQPQVRRGRGAGPGPAARAAPGRLWRPAYEPSVC